MNKTYISIFAALALGLSSCSYDRSPSSGNYDPNDPGFEYAPEGDMYHSVAYDGWTQYEENSIPFNRDSSNQRMPVLGTVARGQAAFFYPYGNTPEGYEAAGANARNPIPATPANIAEGQRLYNMYCWQCHGYSGKNDGSLMKSGKFPKPHFASYQTPYIQGLTDGKIFHVITYGRNLMGAHGHILNPAQRWKVVHYVKQLASMPGEGAPAGGADTTKATGAAPAAPGAPAATTSTPAPAPAGGSAKTTQK